MSKKHINKKYINNKGITLIALVVTIIVLIILAGISLNLIIGKNGIITRAEEQKVAQEIEGITERLELKKADVAFESEKGNVPIDAYIEEVTTSDRMLHEITDVERIDTGNAYITVEDKYVYLLEQEENGNLKITFEGQASKLKPRIQDLEIKTSTNKIEVEVTAVRADKYVFYIKEKDGAEYTKKEENTSGKYIFKDLGQNKEYSIKVEAVNDNGKDEREINRTTGQMTNLSSAEVKYIKSNTNWTNENVITTIEIDTEKDITGYDLQYTKFIGEVTSEKLQNATWTNYSDSGIVSEENETIYTRLYDGYNATSYTSTTIANIDKDNPTISTALASSGVTTKGFTLNVGVTDTESGLGKIVWYYKLSTETSYKNVERVYTELKGNTAGTTTEALKTEIFDNLINGTYNTYIEVYDVAGNSIESAKVEVKLGDILAASGATASPTTWTNGKVTVTLPTQSGYTTEYQVGATTGTWSTYSAAFTVSANTTVYYRYNDGTNAGTYASKSISNIDTGKPTISTALNSSAVTTKGFTLNVGVTDGNSGLGKIVWYYKLSSSSTYTSVEEVYTALNGATAGTKTAITKSKAFNNLASGTYNTYVVVYDVAGNSVESPKVDVTLGTVATASAATATPTTWTNGNVTVTLPTQSGYTTQYQLGGVSGSWTNYSSAFAVSSNTTVYYRYNDGTNAGSYASKSISNIDTGKPTISTALNSSAVTTKGFTLNVGVTDPESGLGKIVWYYKLSSSSTYTSVEEVYTNLNGATAGTKTAITKSKAFNNLASGTYNTYVVIYDVAGNSVESPKVDVTLGTITTAGAATATPTTWTNSNVTVTLPTQSGYTTQYQLGGVSGSWTNYSSAFTVSSNTTVYYRYNDGTNAGTYASKSISNIDKTVPTISTALNSTSVTTKGFTLNVGVTDTASGLGKIVWYYKLSSATNYTSVEEVYTTLNGATAGTKTAITKSKAFNNLASGTYNTYVVVYDVAGNSIESAKVDVTLGTVATASAATATPTTWTNGNVTVTLPTQSGYTTQYQLGGVSGSWTNYSSAFAVSSNTTVYYRYNDGTNAGNYASKVISNIDTTVPTISTALNSNVTIKGFTLNVGVTDTASGLGKIVWYYKLSSATNYTSVEEVYTALNGATAGTKTAITKSKAFNILASGTYNTYVVVYDVAGNSKQSSTINIELTSEIETVEEMRTAGTYMPAKTALKDSNDNLIVVPEGFKIAEDSGINVTEGIVIEDNDIKEGIGNNRGNQYVWIPVSNLNGDGSNKIKKQNEDGSISEVEITLGRYTFASSGTETLKQSAENYEQVVKISSYYQELATARIGQVNESDGLQDTNTTALDLKGFIDSVEANGGYYIARYEASYGTDGKANSKVSNNPNDSYRAPTTEGYLWNNIIQINAATASRGLYEKVNSDLINSYAWDTAIVYIQAFSGDTDYSKQDAKSINSSLTNTGVNGDEVCKINDMASNTSEWTTEYSTYGTSSNTANSGTVRGGLYNNWSMYTSTRCYLDAFGSGKFWTFRPALYM